MKCPACSAELGNPQQFCTKCGTRLVASPGVPSPSKIGFATIVGQKTVIERLRQAINNFSLSRGPADHILLVGPDGMGKRSIACAFAEELGTRVKEVDATTLERLGDLTSVLTAISSSDVLLIRNIGSLRLVFKELLVNALLENRIELLIGRGPGARKHRYDTSRFICIASVQKESDCPPELREAFLLTVPMQDYSEVEMEKLAVMLSQRQDLHIDPLVVPLIVAASRGIPHRLDLMITRLARFRTGRVTEEDATEILAPYGFRAGMRQPFDALEQMQQLTGKQFEELITTVLARSGFRCQMTRASGDGGIDIVAVLDKPLVGGKYLIQCKRYSPGILVGSPIVREFYGAVSADPEAVKGILVTTSGYTEEARKFAQAVGIELIDITRLKALVTENGMWGATSPKPKPGLFDG